MSAEPTPTPALRSAAAVGWGVFLVMAGLPVLLATDRLLPTLGDTTPILWGALLVMLAGAWSLGVGMARWAAHADRANGVMAMQLETKG